MSDEMQTKKPFRSKNIYFAYRLAWLFSNYLNFFSSNRGSIFRTVKINVILKFKLINESQN